MGRRRSRTTTAVFVCAHCGEAVTSLVSRVADVSLISHGDGTDYVPRRGYARADDVTGFEGGLAVNRKAQLQTKLVGRPEWGCCGLTGPPGNRLCRNGHSVGTEITECWMTHGLFLNPSAVRVQDDDGDPALLWPVDPAWGEANGRTGLLLAERIASSGEVVLLPILADALEEGGCGEAVILGHLRAGRPHRGDGCWFVDALLGLV
jgi:hypothetical protein